jgi:hypothetical protein
MKDIADAMSRILADMGDSADKVAAALEAKGVGGARNTTRILNPVVNYVVSALLISSWRMELTEDDKLRFTIRDGECATVPLPQAVKDFLEAFNRGMYPKLEMVEPGFVR